MISEKEYRECYVWVWLPEATVPVVAGKLTVIDDRIVFNYGRSYINNKQAISIYEKELPLKLGIFDAAMVGELPRCIRDSAPDAWGRRVVLNKLLGLKGRGAEPNYLNELTYLMEAGTDRIGALDFQSSATEYIPRISKASLEELSQSVERIEKGEKLTAELDQALCHGSSIGGARPKALLEGKNKKYIAKFSLSTDLYNITKAEFVAMRIAKLCGLNVANVQLTKALGKDVLLVERFDREFIENKWTRKHLLSALTLLDLDEMGARYASYQDFAEIIRHRFKEPKSTLKEIFSRIVFNILCGNTDDHARNHAAFWDGKNLSLTPAYDICPQLRTGGEATQAMIISGDDRRSRLETCLSAAQSFMLTLVEAKELINHQIEKIEERWIDVCEEAELSNFDRSLFAEKLFFKEYAFEDYDLKGPKLK